MLLLLLTVCLYSKHIAFQQLLADNSGGRRIRRHGPNSVLVARLLAGPVPHSSGHAARGRADQSVSVCVRVRVRVKLTLTFAREFRRTLYQIVNDRDTDCILF